GVPGGGDDVQVVRVGATGVALALGNGAADLLTVSNASGAIFVMPASVFGEITGAVALNVPGISVSGTLEIQLNTGPMAVHETLRVGVVPVQVQLPQGPYLRVAGTGVGLTLVGQTLSGDFAFERTLDAGGHAIVRLQASNVSAGLGGNGTPVLALTGGSGSLVVTSTGTAGQLSGNVVLNVPGVSLSGPIALSVNTTAAPANGLPPGPYLRVEAGTAASAATLSVLGQQLSGRFAFEEIRNSLGQRIVRMAATGVEMSFANSMLVVPNGEGVLLILPAGVAGRLSAQVGLAANSGVSLRGSFSLEVNTTSAAISQTFRIGANTTVLDLVAGPFLRVSGDDVSLVVAGQTLSGNFAFEQITTGRGQDGIPGTPDDILALRIAATDVSLSLGDGSVSILSATSGSGTFLIIDRAGSPSPGRGIAGRLSATVALRGVPGVSLSGTLAVEINNTGEEIDEVFFVGGLPVPFQIEAGNYVRVSGTGVRVQVLGQTLTGNFAFEERTVDRDGTPGNGNEYKAVTVTFSEVEFGLGDGTRDFVRVTKGAGTLILIKDGLYGQFSGAVAVDIPDVTFSAAFTVQLNSTSTLRTIFAGSSVSLAANSLKIEATSVTLAIAGQQVSASRFSVEEVTTAAGRVVRITVQNFGLRL